MDGCTCVSCFGKTGIVMSLAEYKRLIDAHAVCAAKVIGALNAAIYTKEIKPTPALMRLLEDLDEATRMLEEHERTHRIFESTNPKSKG